jgi:hypothetical protein
MHSQERRRLYLTVAAAFGSSSLSSLNSCLAYAPAPLSSHQFHSLTSSPSGPSALPPLLQQQEQRPPHSNIHSHQTRLYSFSNKNNEKKDGGGGGFLGALKRGAKKILPFLQSDEEKQAALQRKQVKQDITGGIQQVLRDAPLPIRMMGGMIAPLLGSAVSQLGEAMSSQQELVDTLLQEAQANMVSDATVLQVLGEPIIVGAPFQQGSSTSIINGVSTTRVQAAFSVQGSKGEGVAQMDATQDGITSLIINVNGRSITVGSGTTTVIGGRTSSSSSSSFGKTNLGKNPRNTGDIIDAEFVETNDDKKQ